MPENRHEHVLRAISDVGLDNDHDGAARRFLERLESELPPPTRAKAVTIHV